MTPTTTGPELDQGASLDWGEGVLHPDLAEWVEVNPEGDQWLYHPVLYDSVDSPELIAKANRIYEQKTTMLQEAHRKGDWDRYLVLWERPYRAEKLLEVASEIADHADYWRLVGDVWTDTENAWQFEEGWRELLGANRPKREMIMSASERDELAQLPNPVPVYRGFDRDGLEHWFSWTTDPRQAELFAMRFADIHPGIPRVAIGKVFKPRVLAYFESEHEILVLPGAVSVTRIEPVELSRVGMPD